MTTCKIVNGDLKWESDVDFPEVEWNSFYEEIPVSDIPKEVHRGMLYNSTKRYYYDPEEDRLKVIKNALEEE